MLKLSCNNKNLLAYNVVNTYAGRYFMGRRKGSKGIVFIALGLGLLISLILPAKAVIVILAITVVLCGISLCRG